MRIREGMAVHLARLPAADRDGHLFAGQRVVGKHDQVLSFAIPDQRYFDPATPSSSNVDQIRHMTTMAAGAPPRTGRLECPTQTLGECRSRLAIRLMRRRTFGQARKAAALR